MRQQRTLNPIVFILCLLVWPALAHADFQAGKDAYYQGDYETALKEFRLLAEQGDAQAQNGLGVLYMHGRGVSQDYQEALRWYRLAAAQGYAKAQHNLGVMYYEGQGGPQDFIQAYMWVTLSGEQGFEPAKELLETLEKEMAPAQIAEAQRLAREWLAQHQK